MKKAIVFDFDGVLREFSWDILFKTYQEMGDFLGSSFLDICPNLKIFKKWHDHNWRENIFRMGVRDEEVVVRLVKIFNETYGSIVNVFPWVGYTIKEMSKRYEIAVLSNSFSDGIAKSLDGDDYRIPIILGGDCVERNKPDPEGLEFIMWKFGAEPRSTWIIGDTETDIRAGKSAGVKTAVVAWGATESADDLKALRADKILNEPDQLLSL